MLLVVDRAMCMGSMLVFRMQGWGLRVLLNVLTADQSCPDSNCSAISPLSESGPNIQSGEINF